MRALLPYLALYKRHKWMLLLGVVLAIVTLLASIGLLTLSGWFLSASAVVGVAGIYSFNYMLPAAGVRGAAIIRTAEEAAALLRLALTSEPAQEFLRKRAENGNAG